MTDPLTGYVRVKAVCVFSNDGTILAVRDHDPLKRQSFWVPVGGRVEFGETSGQAIVREVIEELSIEAADLRLLGVLENIFTFDGDHAHEVVFVYDGRLADSSMYQRPTLTVTESNNRELSAHWIDPTAPPNGWPLYPDGLTGLLTTST